MLQIASGRLFKKSPGQRNELRGVLYTNLQTYNQVIETAAGRLLSTSPLHGSKALVYEFTELIEDEPGLGAIASHGIDPYLSDFAAIVSFALNVTCTPDQDLTFRLLRGWTGPSVQRPPRDLVPRVFDDMVWCQPADAVRLFELVGQLISLERRSFRAAMRAVRSYVTGMHRLVDDYELAYTLLVVSMESLAQEFDDFDPQWEDYDQQKRTAIDRALAGADEDLAARVRAALLGTEHVALGRRFREYVLGNLQSSYFRDEARGVTNPMGHSDLDSALRQAYDLRSKYVHRLVQLPDMLTIPGLGETASLPLSNDVLPTFQGLARLARHVITTFIERQPKVYREDYDYSLERVGILLAELAPQYWVGGVKDLDVTSGRRRLEGFLKQATDYLLRGPPSSVTDLRKVLTRVERMLHHMNAEQRRPFVALYVLFNLKVLGDDRMANYDTIVEHYGHELNNPSVEAMLTLLFLNIVPEWSLEEHQEIHDGYFRQKHHQHGLRVPAILETGLSLSLAERYRLAGNAQQAWALVTVAVENHPGHVPLHELEQNFDPTREINWMSTLNLQRPDGDGTDPVARTGVPDARCTT